MRLWEGVLMFNTAKRRDRQLRCCGAAIAPEGVLLGQKDLLDEGNQPRPNP
jgi:hypothetical protein